MKFERQNMDRRIECQQFYFFQLFCCTVKCNFRCNEPWSVQCTVYTQFIRRKDRDTLQFTSKKESIPKQNKIEQCKEKEKIKIEPSFHCFCCLHRCQFQIETHNLSVFPFTFRKLIEKREFFDIENVAFQIWMKKSRWIYEMGYRADAVNVVRGCIYHERVKSRSHSCDNHLDIHRKWDKNWKWLVKKRTHNTIFSSLIFHLVVLCVRSQCYESINRNLIHSRIYPVTLSAVHKFWFPLEREKKTTQKMCT